MSFFAYRQLSTFIMIKYARLTEIHLTLKFKLKANPFPNSPRGRYPMTQMEEAFKLNEIGTDTKLSFFYPRKNKNNNEIDQTTWSLKRATTEQKRRRKKNGRKNRRCTKCNHIMNKRVLYSQAKTFSKIIFFKTHLYQQRWNQILHILPHCFTSQMGLSLTYRKSNNAWYAYLV